MTRHCLRAFLVLCVLGFATQAAAQATHHKLELNLKAIAQGLGSDGLKPDKFPHKSKDVLRDCLGAEPPAEIGLYLHIACGGGENEVLALDIESGDSAVVGTFFFDFDYDVQTTMNGDSVLKAITAPIALEIECKAGGALQVTGIADLVIRKIASFDCLHTMKATLHGLGYTPGAGTFIVDDGSSVTAKKPVAVPP